MNINDHAPSKELYLLVRSGFVAQGSTLTAWCRSQKVNPTNARSALAGVWNGPKGKLLRSRLIEASGITTPSESETQSSKRGAA